MTNFALIKSKMAASWSFNFFFFIILESCMIADLSGSIVYIAIAYLGEFLVTF